MQVFTSGIHTLKSTEFLAEIFLYRKRKITCVRTEFGVLPTQKARQQQHL